MSFQEKVYAIAKTIPKGKVVTYAQLATLAGSPKASRAVGMCMKNNPDKETIPCHRVVSSNGKLTGYAFGGIEVKKEILIKEGVQMNGDKVNLEASKWEIKSI